MMSNKSILTLMLYAACLYGVMGDCMHPRPAANYTNDAYSGHWYEVGRIQTPGGASFQENCLCTTADFTSEFPIVGDGKVVYKCRNYTEDGELVAMEANLLAGDVPGNFKEKFNNFLPAVDYNVIWLDEDYAMEYDCRSVVVTQVDEYCVHFMSRTKTIDDEKLQEMIQFAENLGLNPENIAYFAVDHSKCLS